MPEHANCSEPEYAEVSFAGCHEESGFLVALGAEQDTRGAFAVLVTRAGTANRLSEVILVS
jgi:hypothetical protein